MTLTKAVVNNIATTLEGFVSNGRTPTQVQGYVVKGPQFTIIKECIGLFNALSAGDKKGLLAKASNPRKVSLPSARGARSAFENLQLPRSGVKYAPQILQLALTLRVVALSLDKTVKQTVAAGGKKPGFFSRLFGG